MLSRQLKAFPSSQKMVVEVAKHTCLPGCISTKTLDLERTGRERGNGFIVALLKPMVGSPLQGLENTPHLFPK